MKVKEPVRLFSVQSQLILVAASNSVECEHEICAPNTNAASEITALSTSSRASGVRKFDKTIRK